MQRSRGFTLVEVMLAITLVALIMGMAYGGFRASIRATTSGEQRIEDTNRLRVTHQFIRRQLSQARPLIIEQSEDDPEVEQIRFLGETERVRFVAPMPGYLSYGGQYVQELRLERGDEGFDLVFYFALLNGYLPGDLEDSEGVVLLEEIDSGGFFFLDLDPEDQVPFWADFWEDPSRLPLAVGLNIDLGRDDGLSWPELVTPVLVDGGGGGARREIRTGADLLGAPRRTPGARR
ncbi:MAG: prepilin-type N-terminal cleavage/methylation domain-containing protein [Wenzhouxiangella sp.]